jgi:hypothetical protein
MVEITQSGGNLQAMASTLIQAFNDGRVELYEEPNLRRDLQRARVEERNYGYRLTWPRDEHGHGDTGTAFALAMLGASEVAAEPVQKLGANLLGEASLDTAFEQFLQRKAEFARSEEEYGRSVEDPTGFLSAIKEGQVRILGRHRDNW